MDKEKRSFIVKPKGHRFLDRYSYSKYAQFKREKQIPKEEGVDLKGYKKIGSEIFREIGNQIVERPGGVFIRNFGYFFNARFYYNGLLNLGNGNIITQPLYKNKVFKPMFIADALDIEHTFWNIEGKFSTTITGRVTKEALNGRKYKAYFYSMRPLLHISLTSKNTFYEDNLRKEYQDNEQLRNDNIQS